MEASAHSLDEMRQRQRDLEQSQADLRRSEERFRSVLDNSLDVIYRLNVQSGRFEYISPSAEKVVGFTPDELMAQSPETALETIHPDDRSAMRTALACLEESGESAAEYRQRAKNGEYKWLSNRMALTRDGAGRPLYRDGNIRDIAKRKQAEESLRESMRREHERAEELAVLLDAAPTPVIIVHDAEALHMTGNRAANELIRVPSGGEFSLSAPTETKPRHFKPIKDGRELRLDELPAQRAARGEHVHDFEFDLVFDDGAILHVLGYGTPLLDEHGNPRGAVHALVDITERKQAEESLRQARDELEQRVAERTAELAARAQQLRLLASELTLAEQRERGRLAQVLHDGLQQVLVASRMRLARLERIQDHEVRERTREVDELLAESIEISRSLTAELSPPILREGGLIPGLEWLARWMNDKQGLNVIFDARAQIEPMSEDLTVLLFQATRELLFNVVKHAQVKAARVRVDRHADAIRITVADEGVGFDPVRIKQHGAGGGFGLFSIRERLELFGGQFLIISKPGEGCEVIMNVPLIAPTTARTVSASTSSVAVAKPPDARDSAKGNVIRVMLVDDHLVMRQGLKMLIRDNSDMGVIGEASDGRSAIELARQIQPDVILMDISMPGMNGIEATQVIHDEWPKVRIIGLSMFQEADQAKAMRQAGAQDYLAKSAPSAEMLAAIRRDSGSNSPWFQIED